MKLTDMTLNTCIALDGAARLLKGSNRAVALGYLLVGLLLLAGAPIDAWAQASLDSSKPATLLCDVMNFMTSTVAKVVGVIAVVVSGIMFAIGETKGAFSTGMALVFGIGIAVGAVSLVKALSGGSICGA